MNRHLHSPTILTEFARTFEEEQETIFTKLVNRLTNNNRPSNESTLQGTVLHEEPSGGDSEASGRDNRTAQMDTLPASSSAIRKSSTSSSYTDAESTTSAQPTSGERTTTSVLRRLSSLISQKPNTKRSYKNTELHKFWMPDSTSIECYDCSVKFTTFRRKHHCRLCGQIFCTKCCNQVVTGKIINCSEDLRVCNYCSKVVFTYLKSSNISADLKPDLKALQEDLAQKLSTLQPPGSGGPESSGATAASSGRNRRKISVGYQEERFAASAGSGISSADRKSILQQSNSLKTLYDEMCRSLPLYNRGHELIDFLFSRQKSSNNMQAIAILNAMIDAGFLIAIYETKIESSIDEEATLAREKTLPEQAHQRQGGSSGGSAEDEEDGNTSSIEFSEDTVYKLAVLQDRPAGAPGLVAGAGEGAYHLELNFKSSSVLMRSGNEDQSSVDSEDGAGSGIGGSTTLSSIILKDSAMDSSYLISTGAKALLKAFCEHEELLVNQLLRAQNLDPSWSKTLIPIVARVANTMRLDEAYGTDAMDIRNYVYFKKVPGGDRSESQILGGVVFSKNVAHKEMSQKVDKPKILLLQCAIAYQRVEGKFVSFDTLMLQERDYLRNKVSKIISLGPNIVLVHKNVAGIAQDMLRNKGITLVLDVKLCVLERIARFLDCDIISCIDSNVGQPKLGICDRFRIQTFYDDQGSSKTLMCLEKQHSPRGCCVLLRGAKRSELAKIKKIASLLLLARHNWRFELSYLCDVYAMPPTPRASIFDSKESSPSDPPPLLTRKSVEEPSSVLKENQTPATAKMAQIEPTTVGKTIRTTTGSATNRENVGDWTDPLRSGALGPSEDGAGPDDDEDDTSFELAAETPHDNRFRSALSSTILSISPFVAFPLPYLETDSGRKCALRCYFPDELYYSKQWSNGGTLGLAGEKFSAAMAENAGGAGGNASTDEEEKQLLPVHPFVTHKITTSVESKEMQTILASFRANGGRYPKVSMMKKTSTRKRRLTTIAQRSLEEFVYRDALDIENHQRLPVLFCSFNYNENVPSTFCAQPSYLDMQFYGQNDIMLGLFLEHYCFRSSYICKSCNLPMMDHVRRYVHSGGCIQVKLVEDVTKMDTGTILISSRCTICNEYSKPAPMSQDTWCYSFAKFLELRFHGHAYKKRNCEGIMDQSDGGEEGGGGMVCRHSLHRDFEQNFSYKGIVASFRYTAIDVWEIVLPAMSISLVIPATGVSQRTITDQRTEEMKTLAIMGYDVFVKILEKLAELSVDTDTFAKLKKKANQDQVAFKQRIEKVQKLLTEDVLSVELIDDAIVTLKHSLAEAIEEWEPKLHDIINQTKSAQASKPSAVVDAGNGNAGTVIDSGTIATEELDLSRSTDNPDAFESSKDPIETEPIESTSAGTGGKLEQDAMSVDAEDDKIVSNASEEKQPARESLNEKKTVKTILSQLLSTNDYSHILSSPLPPHEHHGLKAGLFPIVVNEQDLGSCIAYSLMSQEYRKMLDSMLSGGTGGVITIGASENSPNMKRKSTSVSSTTDAEDSPAAAGKNEQDKKHKNASHSEIHFQDANCNFVCRIYFAKEFDLLRCQILKRPAATGTTHRGSGTLGNTAGTVAGGNGGNGPGGDANETSQEVMETVRKMFARSLSKSVRWEARGGKSGSKFSKTVDDRFVLKEMSRTDLTIFENFAPNYFEYLQRCMKQKHITLLAKIFGVFKITIKRKDNTTVESAVLVMENLFCGKDIKEKYDLKGSDRNRLVDPNRQTGTERVLMDENFIQMSWTNPLYILSHSKTVLKEAITRDACFLERNEVMDYSLLVGLESSEKNLVIGIIDYIRTYTLDKKFESMIKQSGLMGGHGKLPTVVSPKMYKSRFIVAMERYFLCVPDRWEGLSKK